MPDLKARKQNIQMEFQENPLATESFYAPDLAFQQSCALQNRPIFLVFPAAIDETGTDKVAAHPLWDQCEG